MHDNTSGRRRRSRKELRLRRKARRRRVIGTTATTVVALSATFGYLTTRDPDGKAQAASGKSSTFTATPRPSPSRSVPAPVPSASDSAAVDLSSALKPVTTLFGQNRMAVAVQEIGSRRRATFGEGSFDTASIVKVDILAALLLQAQDAGRTLTDEERAYAAAMIQKSGNASTSVLWEVIGSAAGLDAANRRLGLIETRGGIGTAWGITQTTAADQITLLQAVFSAASPLSPASRSYIQDLMYHVSDDQDWGVSAAAEPGKPAALKNGWLQRSRTKRWDVNSIGRIERNGRVYLTVVLLNNCSTQQVGIRLVEQAVSAAVTALAKAATS
ncbi:serine hydrolase [Streptomyces sp. NPDC008238]